MKASGIFLCLYLFSYQTWAHKGKRLYTTLEGSVLVSRPHHFPQIFATQSLPRLTDSPSVIVLPLL